MRLFISTLLSSFLFHCGLSQIPANDWVKTFGGPGRELALESKIDPSGNIVTVGFYNDSVDLDPGTGVYGIATHGDNDAFIQKLDANGNFIWAKVIHSTTSLGAYSVDFDKNGNVYVTGGFSGPSVDFDPDPVTTHYLTRGPQESRGFYTLKLDGSGNFVWATAQTGRDVVRRIITDSVGNSYCMFAFLGQFDLDPSPSGTNFTSSSFVQTVIQKLDSAGNLVWSRLLSSTSGFQGQELVLTSQGEVVLVGAFKGTCNLQSAGVLVNNTSEDKGIVVTLDDAGTYQKAFFFQGSGYCEISDVVSDANQNLYLAGRFDGVVDLNPGPSGTSNTPNHEGLFVAKYNNLDSLLWYDTYETDLNLNPLDPNVVADITIDQSMNLFITGQFDQDLVHSQATLTSNGDLDIFLAQYDSAGTPLWLDHIGAGSRDESVSLLVNQDNFLHLTGRYSGNVAFDPSKPNTTVNAASTGNIFIVKFNKCNDTGDSVIAKQISACAYFTIPDGTVIYSGNGNFLYIDSIARDQHGCDSVLILHEVVFGISPQASIAPITNGFTWLGADSLDINSTLQWYDCNTNQPIPGATDTTFFPTEPGSYSLLVTKDGCTVNSSCLDISEIQIGLAESSLDVISIYPNPVTSLLYINAGPFEAEQVLLYTISGKLLLQTKEARVLDLSQLSSGLYVLIFEIKDKTFSTKFIKE